MRGRCTKAMPRGTLRPYTSSFTLRPYTSSFTLRPYTSSFSTLSLHFVPTLRRWRNRLGVATKCIRLRVATKSFRAWRGGKAVPRPAHSAALVTALQIFPPRRARYSNHVNPVKKVSCFSPETYDLRPPVTNRLSLTDYKMHSACACMWLLGLGIVGHLQNPSWHGRSAHEANTGKMPVPHL